jgi:DhnA family fructose-bisphosphate aldolase class Ia
MIMAELAFLPADGRIVAVAIDHPLYSWPCKGLEDRARLIEMVVAAGADAIISTYGTIRDARAAFGKTAAVLKLDLTTVTLGSSYDITDHVPAWTVDDAVRLGAKAVMTYVQLGAPFELEALRAAARIAAGCDKAGLAYVCEIMPVESARFPDAYDPQAITAACRTAAELGAHVIKTTIPTPPERIGDAVPFGVPIILAGGNFASDKEAYYAGLQACMKAGAKGVAVGRNVWGSPDPGAVVRRLVELVHGRQP